MKGESEAPGEGGLVLFIENSRRGGVFKRGGWGVVESVFAGKLGGGAKYFFSGLKFPPRLEVLVSCRTCSQCIVGQVPAGQEQLQMEMSQGRAFAHPPK